LYFYAAPYCTLQPQFLPAPRGNLCCNLAFGAAGHFHRLIERSYDLADIASENRKKEGEEEGGTGQNDPETFHHRKGELRG
jgi:hypothetical protein